MNTFLKVTFIWFVLSTNALAQTSNQGNLTMFANNLQDYIKSKTANTCKFEPIHIFCTSKPVKKKISNSNKMCTISEALKLTFEVDCGDGFKSMTLGWEIQDGTPVVSIDGEEITLHDEKLPEPTRTLSSYLKADQSNYNPWFSWAFTQAKERLGVEEKGNTP